MKKLLLLTLSLLVMPSAVPAASVAGELKVKPQLRLERALSLRASVANEAGRYDLDQPVSFTGTWKTIAGGSNQYTVILKQVGNKVTGNYSPGNGKIFDGVVVDRKLSFKWTQDGGFEGTAEFTMDEDGKGFIGSSTALKPREFTNTWNTYKPPVSSFAGTWETISTGQYPIQLTMVQNGDKVTGIYPSHSGKIEGTVSGRVLRFKWQSDGGSGSGRLVMDELGQAFSGTYNQGDDPDEVDATWNGKLLRSFAGTWSWSWPNGKTESTVLFKFQQAGSQVTGYGYDTRKADDKFYFKDATVSGNTLTFQIEAAPGSLEQFVLAEDGKSFKGKFRTNDVSATFVGP